MFRHNSKYKVQLNKDDIANTKFQSEKEPPFSSQNNVKPHVQALPRELKVEEDDNLSTLS